jgi:hypothetical protein
VKKIFAIALLFVATAHAQNIVAQSVNKQQYVSQFMKPGVSLSQAITNACTALAGQPGTVIIEGYLPTGQPIVFPPWNCTIVDWRNTAETAGAGNYLSGVEIYRRDTRNASASATLRSAITLRFDDYDGGVNLLSNKTQSQLIAGIYDGRDKGEHHGFVNIKEFCQGSGDCLAEMHYLFGYGGFGAPGDEGQEIYRGWNNVGDGTAGGNPPTSASITVSGNSISGTWTNVHELGVRNAPLIITSRGTYSTGTVTGAAMSGGICHVTGFGTSWNALTNIIAIEFPQLEAGTAKFVVPVTAINSNTDLSMDYNINEIGATCPTLVAGTYVLYKGSQVASLGAMAASSNDPASVNVVSGAPFINGDAVEQPIDFNVAMTGYMLTQYSPFTTGGFHKGMYVQNIGPAQLESGIRINGNTGGYQFGIRLMNKIGQAAIIANTAPILFQLTDASSGSNVIVQVLNSGFTGRNFTYDRTNDWWNIGHLFMDANTSRISLNSSPQPSTAAYIGLNNAAWHGLDVSNVVDPDASHALFRVFSNSNEHFEVNKAKAFFLGTGMNVGIGIAAPGAKLQVVGDIDENELRVTPTAGQGSDTVVITDSAGNAAFDINGIGNISIPNAINHDFRITNQSNHGIILTVNGATDSMFLPGDGTARITGGFTAGFQVTTFSATPTFDLSTGNVFDIVLNGNVTASSFTHGQQGQLVTFIICQDGTGGWTFAWGASFLGADAIGATANKCNVQQFVWLSSTLKAVAAMKTNE